MGNNLMDYEGNDTGQRLATMRTSFRSFHSHTNGGDGCQLKCWPLSPMWPSTRVEGTVSLHITVIRPTVGHGYVHTFPMNHANEYTVVRIRKLKNEQHPTMARCDGASGNIGHTMDK